MPLGSADLIHALILEPHLINYVFEIASLRILDKADCKHGFNTMWFHKGWKVETFACYSERPDQAMRIDKRTIHGKC
jgi:hypothetical protein